MELLILLGLILFNGVFAMSEMAIASVRRARLQAQVEQGNHNAKIALELVDSPNRFLSTVQIFITLISIIQGVFGGQAFASGIAQFIRVNIPMLAEFSEPIGYTIIIGATVYLSLVVGELVPKRLALQNAERIAMLVAPPMSFLATLATPLVWLLSKSTNLIIRLLGISAQEENAVTQMEVLAMVEEGVNTGVFEEREQEMVEAVLRLDERRMGSLVTPRTEIVWIDLNDTPEDISRKISQEKYSSYPVGRENVDNIVGIVEAKDLLAQLIKGQPLNIEAAMTPPVFIPESVSAASAIQQFKREGIHTALIVSEYGGIEGMVRMHDIIEQVFGELDGGKLSNTESDAVQRDDGAWIFEGQYMLTKLEEHFPDFDIPFEENGKYETVAGFIMARLGKVPQAHDQFDYRALYFEVLKMEGVRIDKVLVKPATPKKEDHHEQS
jgi:putative hemolysin